MVGPTDVALPGWRKLEGLVRVGADALPNLEMVPVHVPVICNVNAKGGVRRPPDFAIPTAPGELLVR